MHLIFDVLLYFSIAALLGIVSMILGHGIANFSRFYSSNQFWNGFIALLFGSIALSCITATFFTKGVSILSLAALFFIGLLIYNRKSQKAKTHKTFYLKDLKYPFLIFVVFIVVSGILSLLVGLPESIATDFTFYGKVAQQIGISGQENIYHYFNTEIDGLHGTIPYHYFELWLAHLTYRVSDLPPVLLLEYTIGIFLKSTVALGTIALLTRLGFRNIIQLIVLGLFILCFDALPSIGVNFGSWEILSTPWLRPNFLIYFLFIIPLIWLFLGGTPKKAGFFFLLLPFFSTVTAPAIFTGYGLFWTLQLLTKKINIKSWLLNVGVGICVAIFILGFYKSTGVQLENVDSDMTSPSALISKTMAMWKAIVGATAQILIKLFALIFLALLIAKLVLKNSFNTHFIQWAPLLTFTICSVLAGVFFFQAVPYMDDMYQLPYIGYCMLSGLLFFFVVAALAKLKTSIPTKLFISCIALLLAVLTNYNQFTSPTFSHNLGMNKALKNGHDPVFLYAVSHQLSTQDAWNFGWIISENNYDVFGPKKRNALTTGLGLSLDYLHPNVKRYPLVDKAVLFKDIPPQFQSRAHRFNDLLPFYARNKYNGFHQELYFDDKKLDGVLLLRNTIDWAGAWQILEDNKSGLRLYQKTTKK